MSSNIVKFTNVSDQIEDCDFWNPSYISTSAWYDPSDASTITTATGVSQLDDKSGNNHHLTQENGAEQPEIGARTLNNLNLIHFNGSNHFMTNYTLDYGSGSPDIQMIGVILSDGDGSNVGYYFGYSDGIGGVGGGPGEGQVFSASDTGSSANRYYTGRYFNGYQSTTKAFTAGQAFIVSHAYPAGSTHVQNEIYIDGTSEVTTGNNNTGLLNFAGTNNQMCIGKAHALGVNYLEGAIGEIIMFNSILSEENRQKLEGYLAWKWGLVSNIPSNHPYKNELP